MQVTQPPIDNLSYQLYRFLQEGKAAFSLFHKAIDRQVAELFGLELPNLDPANTAAIDCILEGIGDLFSRDWRDAEAGVYPSELLFENAWEELPRHYAALWSDRLDALQRQRAGRFREFDSRIATELYPNYYLQNFHGQTDGYLSDRSAEIYDLQVDLLFNGTADAMRRRVLAPLKLGLREAFREIAPHQIQVLDVACGTGRTLRGMRAALPQASLHGLDLSHPYLQRADRLLRPLPAPAVQLLQGNAEQLPYRDCMFQGLTCVFATHELPGPVRQKCFAEMFRVLQPGGIAIICDSTQLQDVPPALASIIADFPLMVHEPYFRDYLKDNLEVRLATAGFVVDRVETVLISKYWIARKPA